MTRESLPEVTASLAAFVVGHDAGGIPAHVRQHAVRCIFNGVGTALGGANDRAIVALLDTLGAFSGPADTTLIGRSRRVDMLTATFLNAAAMNVFDFDDTHFDTIIHPTAPVLPALFALAERHERSGAALVDAFILGCEVECRIGVGVSPGHYKRGWHITSTCGVFGAAAAAGRLIGLNQEQMIWAFGNASAQSSGLVETLGSMAKSVGVGQAGRGGLIAALMAEQGVEGPPMPLEGERGFVRAFSDTVGFEAITDQLGDRWEFMQNACKPYPCGVVLNAVIDACLALRDEINVTDETVEQVEVIGNSLLGERTDRPAIRSGREAQVSAQHAVAVTLLRGSAGIADFDDAAVDDTDVRALRGRVTLPASDDALPMGAARVVVRLADGRTVEKTVAEPTGSPARPMTDEALKSKFEALAAYGSPQLDPEPLAEALWSLDGAPEAGQVIAAVRVSR